MKSKNVLLLAAAVALLGCLAVASQATSPSAFKQANMLSTKMQNGTFKHEIGVNDPPAAIGLKVGDEIIVTVTFGVAPQPMEPHPIAQTTDGKSGDTLNADYVPQPIGSGQTVQLARFVADRAGTADIIWPTFEGGTRTVTKVTVTSR